MGASQRRKGHNFERYVVNQFATVFGKDNVKRGWQCRYKHSQPDVDTPLFFIECKVGARHTVERALIQAEADCPRGITALAVTKRDRTPPIASLRLDDFLELVGELWHYKTR